ncbi:MAG: glycosyltransferase family 4 protein [bacterium]|nr:glycosyltransferase family 4 protein [bacterium]
MNEEPAAPSTVVWTGWPEAPAPLGRIRRAGQPVTVVDEAGQPVAFGAWTRIRELVRALWLRGLDLVLGGIAALAAGRTTPDPKRSDIGQNPSGKTVLVLPVLPDLSHTFVYRETLAILRQRPDWPVVVLAKNPGAPVHSEAEQLAQVVEYLPRDGITKRAVRVLRWLLRRTGRDLFALYRSEAHGSTRSLLGKLPLRDPRHPGNAFALADHLRRLGAGRIHVYSSTYPANVALGAGHLLGIPVSISSYVDFEFPYDHRMRRDKLERAHFFRVVTRFCADRLRELEPDLDLTDDRVPVVYLGLDLENWQDRAQPAQRGVLVSAARLVAKKGLHLMPPALAMLRAQNIEFEWRVCGDGPELPRLRALAAEHGVADRSTFLGAQDNTAVRAELMRADGAVLPCVVAEDGERDGIPIFLCEAMALGVTVVTTPISGIPELVRDGETGLLCETESVESLAVTLARLCDGPAAAAAIAARGREEVHRVLDVDAAATDLIRRIET